MNTIELRNISKAYKLYGSPKDRLKEALHPFRKSYHTKFYALRDISLIVGRGETMGIIGSNGSGKSTLLKIIAKVLTPSSGDLMVAGSVSSILELGVGFNPEFNAIENIYFNGTIMGYSQEQIAARVDPVLSFADIGDFVQQPVKTYSSGMYTRLAFALAVSVEPEILILDEVLAVGDIYFQAKCMAKMKKMKDDGVTILLVSHDMESIKGFCEQALWLDAGTLRKTGPTSKVISAYTQSFVEHINMAHTGGQSSPHGLSGTDLQKFEDLDFMERVSDFRTGSGHALFKNIEFLDTWGAPLPHNLQYNQEIVIKAYVELMEDCKNIAVVYHILNRQRQYILGDDTFLSETDIFQRHWKKGEHFVVTFRSKLPLLHGTYSVGMMISTFTDTRNFSDPVFLDWIDNAYVFEMQKRTPFQIFDYVHFDIKDNVTCHVIRDLNTV